MVFGFDEFVKKSDRNTLLKAKFAIDEEIKGIDDELDFAEDLRDDIVDVRRDQADDLLDLGAGFSEFNTGKPRGKKDMFNFLG